MQTDNRLFDDLARVASGALSTLAGLREEIEMRVKERFERFAGEVNLVTREEFDAVKALAAKAREEQEELAARVAALEERVAALERTPARTVRRTRRKTEKTGKTERTERSGKTGATETS